MSHKKMSVSYMVVNDKHEVDGKIISMDVEIGLTGDLTIKFDKGKDHLKFQESDPYLVEAVAENLLEAVQLAKQEEFPADGSQE